MDQAAWCGSGRCPAPAGKGERAQMHACELEVATAPLTDSKSPRMRISDDARFLTKAVLKRLNALAVKKPSKVDFKVFSLRCLYAFSCPGCLLISETQILCVCRTASRQCMHDENKKRKNKNGSCPPPFAAVNQGGPLNDLNLTFMGGSR